MSKEGKMTIPLVDLKRQYQSIKEEIDAAIQRVVDSQYFILGPEVERFEEEVADYCHVRHAIGVASGTDAILLPLRAAGIGEGDEVITTPFTFIATTECISRMGAKIVFVDIDPKTYNLDVNKVEAAITEKTKAIIPVHLYGHPVDMDPLIELAEQNHLLIVEDAAQAFGAEYKGKKVGSIGHIGCFSFFPSKSLGCYGDGGMVVTNDDKIADMVRMLRVHGCKQKYYHLMDGYKSRLDALQAAILRAKLKYIDQWNERRRRNAALYNELLQKTKVITPYEAEYGGHIYNYYVIRSKDRDNLQSFLKSKGIDSAVYYPVPLHLQPVYSNLGYSKGDFSISEQVSNEVLALPMFPELTQDEIKYIVKNIEP